VLCTKTTILSDMHSPLKASNVQVQPLMDALVSSPGFAALPGPVRVSVVDILLADMARSLVWRSVPRLGDFC
jgi:hypothetical protein